MKVLLCMALVGISLSLLGVNIDQSISLDQLQCMKSQGIRFVLTQGQNSQGQVDANGVKNLLNAQAAGLYADLYFYPCIGRNIDSQVAAFISFFDSKEQASQDEGFLPQTDVFTGPSLQEGPQNDEIIVEEQKILQEKEQENIQYDNSYEPSFAKLPQQGGCSYFDCRYANNCNYLQSLINAFKSRGKSVGIYSRRDHWQAIFGQRQSCNQFKDLPLWYANQNGQPNVNDWSVESFGGWTEPILKQYVNGSEMCGTKVNMVYY